jgi:dihydroorotate dehydrogenase electron transfer subunit
MIQTQATIEEVEHTGHEPYARILVGGVAFCASLSAGRFVLADLGGLVRDVLFPAHVGHNAFDVLVPPAHPIAHLRSGERVGLMGPLGRGFEVPARTRRLLLVADALRLPVVLPLVVPARDGDRECALLLAAAAAEAYHLLGLLPPVVEVHMCAIEPSEEGTGALAYPLCDLVEWADHVCVAADPRLYPQLAQAVRDHRLAPGSTFAEALVSSTMACGVGACRGCAVATSRGPLLACRDGPVFDLLELRGP